MKYIILESGSTEKLISDVNEALKDGWQLHCGLNYVSTPCGGVFLAQAMIKETK